MGGNPSFKYVTRLRAEVPISIVASGDTIKKSMGESNAECPMLISGIGLKTASRYSDTEIVMNISGADMKSGIGNSIATIAIAGQGLGTNAYCIGSSESVISICPEGVTFKYSMQADESVNQLNLISFGKYARYMGLWNVARQEKGSFVEVNNS